MTPPQTETPTSPTPSGDRFHRLLELAQLFSKLGIIGFGGPQAHIALINDEAVERRNWLTQEQFTEGLAVCEMLPGPASTQMGIYTGYVYAGQLGALVAGIAFIAPAFVIVVALSWAYFRFQQVPQVEAIFLGVSPVVVAIILAFCWKLGKRAIKDKPSVAIALITFVITLVSPLSVLLQFIVAGLVRLWIDREPPTRSTRPTLSLWGIPWLPAIATVPAEPLAASSLWGWERIATYGLPLGWFFLKVGSFIFGGGLVIIPLLEADVVERFGWMTQSEFLNSVAIGQISPGPVVLTAAVVGYKVAGILGALVSSVAIFTPSFLFIMAAAPLLLRIRQNPQVKRFLKGVMPAVLGAIAAAVVPLAQSALVQESLLLSAGTVAIAIATLVALLRFKTPTWQLIPAGAIAGFILGSL